MASITNEPNGRRTIQFVAPDGKRRSIRLGKVSKRLAETCKIHIETVVAARRVGQNPPPETTAWLESLNDSLYERLGQAGLVATRSRITLVGFIDQYRAQRTDAKPNTHASWYRVRQRIASLVGESVLLREFTPADATRFRLALIEQGLADATVRKSISICKQFYTAAIRERITDSNPFEDLPSAPRPNKSREFYVTREMVEQLLASTDDPEWRLLIALARYGGLRTPSEPLALCWHHVEFERQRLSIPSPKTEHHEGRGVREMPLFPKLEPFLIACRPDETSGGPIITRYRDASCNLRSRLLKHIVRAGLTAWPRLWQNLRASCETDLVEDFPAHVVSAWIGHSVSTAERHYLQVTDEHFAKAVQKAVQHLHE